eukprot:SAG31_NODE_27012_length_432_cov_1.237237_1_plen_77_part_00
MLPVSLLFYSGRRTAELTTALRQAQQATGAIKVSWREAVQAQDQLQKRLHAAEEGGPSQLIPINSHYSQLIPVNPN